jgi:CBS domain-containing protein
MITKGLNHEEVFMQISEIMHQGVVTANINDTIKKVAGMMKEEDIGAIPIMEEGRAVGFVTDRDIVISCVAEGRSLDESISHAMTEDVICIDQSRPLEEAGRIMQENKVSRLLVVDNNEKPVGMVSLQDLSESAEEETLAGETLSKIKEV